MNKKAISMLIMLIIVGQIIYFVWNPETNVLLLAKAMLIVFVTKILGDFLGKHMFRLPYYNRAYLRDYIKSEFLTTAGLNLAFGYLWYIPVIRFFWKTSIHGGSPNILMHIYAGGILPALFYYALNLAEISEEKIDERRLKRKL